MLKRFLIALMCALLTCSLCALAESTPDVDLTALNPTEAVDALFALADAPEDNQGKTVRLTGYVNASSWDGEVTYLLLSDPASCCVRPVEFVPATASDAPDALAGGDQLVTLQGVVEIFNDYGYDDVRLIDATIL